ncbi:amino acid transporter [Deinococcus irradiatisoli]|uniref:Amino acid transporter n=1 Tax=Deinococcus irradiatisoli TaxID=2202254 RepID=A0A2Z3JH18_9DEIO|nr:amino acid transporter [Deinococcus irradiatisoli]AWN24295.1 amino acid transporter [Deinococcus irradiatisoli]
MCLTGVDYFSTLGYQPGIAAVAAGALAPLATLVLVALTLLGALPVYRRVAGDSPHGEGSMRMLERLLPGWPSKLLVLVLLGFAATDFIITITLSAADAAAHLIENPFLKTHIGGWQIPVTLALVLLLGGVFLKGFREAIGLAVVLVVTYLLLNGVVIGRGLLEVVHHPEVLSGWWTQLGRQTGGWGGVALASLLVFPKLALGLSGFETGVSVMPQVRGAADDDPIKPAGRVRNTQKLLAAAALIMSVLLLTSTLVVTLLVPNAAMQDGGPASGRALAYLAHAQFGEVFGTLYDLSTILILWFAGASAMTGLLNIVPRFLPRYGMVPGWAQSIRPLTLVFTGIGLLITVLFKANVDAQGGAYATGVLVLMSSAAFAVTLAAWRQRDRLAVPLGFITLVFLYTTVLNVVERPDGLKIATFFILSILAVSLISRVVRSTELRVTGVELDLAAREFVRSTARSGALRVIAHRPDLLTAREYREKAREARLKTHLPDGADVLFLEVSVANASDFDGTLEVQGKTVGSHHVLRVNAPAVPNAIAALLLHLRDSIGIVPDVYFGWDEQGPLENAASFFLFGEGDIAPLTREVLRRAEPDGKQRPLVHVGG